MNDVSFGTLCLLFAMTVVLADVTITRTTPHCSAVAVTKDLGIGELGGALLTCQDSLDSSAPN